MTSYGFAKIVNELLWGDVLSIAGNYFYAMIVKLNCSI